MTPDERAGDARGHVAGRQRRAAPAARARSGQDVCRQDRHGAGHLATRDARAARQDRNLRDHGWFMFFAPRDNPEIAGVVFAEHGEHGYNCRADREAHDGDVLRQEGRAAAAVLARRRRRRRCAVRRQRSRSRRRRARRERSRSSTMFERRLYFHLDWLLLGAVLAARRLGARDDLQHDLRTASRRRARRPQFWTQLYALGIGLVALLVCLLIDYRMLAEHSLFSTAACSALLVFVLFFGVSADGRAALDSVGLQPAAVRVRAVALALMLAMCFGENRRGAREHRRSRRSAASSSSCRSSSSRKQPDLGTAVTLLPVFLGVAYLAGLRLRLLGDRSRWSPAARAGRLDVRAEGLPAVAHRRRSWIRSRTRAAPAISRSRRASPSGRAG